MVPQALFSKKKKLPKDFEFGHRRLLGQETGPVSICDVVALTRQRLTVRLQMAMNGRGILSNCARTGRFGRSYCRVVLLKKLHSESRRKAKSREFFSWEEFAC